MIGAAHASSRSSRMRSATSAGIGGCEACHSASVGQEPTRLGVGVVEDGGTVKHQLARDLVNNLVLRDIRSQIGFVNIKC